MPGVKSGFWAIGVIGPRMEEILCLMHVSRKVRRVGLMSMWDLHSGGMCCGVIHGSWANGRGDIDCSNWIQSLYLACMFQSMILARWLACWYFLISGSPIPPLSLGDVSLR